ncbi:unnamed protein product [Trichobilharzia regenti]|uniref:G_PROTEIN_RECEP_F1_2 domain-containing protein n=1 Tax=Trichobilharzia regenti TaxID=157069 RepID=A0A183VJ27_TRIRE|nr:unnamed protein product [Trichobilharzia regenti]VDP94374.1 unnamed protein product [Trichobilharzia regenti]
MSGHSRDIMPSDSPMQSQSHICGGVNEEEYISFTQSTISAVVLSLICLFGVIGNSLVIIVYCVKPKHQAGRLFKKYNNVNSNSNHKVNNIPTTTTTTTITTTNANNNLTQDISIPEKPTTGIHVNKMTRPTNSTVKPLSHKLLRRQDAFSQQNLILLLAFVDLLTCVLILPWDIYRVVNFASTGNNIPLSVTLQNYYAVESRANVGRIHIANASSSSSFYFNYELDAILTLLRNIVFACEGSLLAAIAFERYMILVEPDICNSICCYASGNRAGRMSESNRKVVNSGSIRFSFTKNSSSVQKDSSVAAADSIYATQLPGVCDVANVGETSSMKQVNKSKSNNGKYKGVVVCKPSMCIMSILISVTVGTCLLECILIVLHFTKSDCRLTDKLRELVNQIYILCTFLSFFIITYLYVRIFMMVRENDLRRQKWSVQRSTFSTSLKIINESNPLSQSLDNNSETETVVRMADETESNPSIVNGNPCKCKSPQQIQSTRSRLPIRFTKQVSCDQVVTTSHDCYQREAQEFPMSPLKRHKILKTPSMSAIFHHRRVRRHEKTSTASMSASVRSDDQASENDLPLDAGRLGNSRATRKSPQLLPLDRLISRRVVRSHRTGLMIFISTVVFYATLFPVLWVHFRFWWKQPTIDLSVNNLSVVNVTSLVVLDGSGDDCGRGLTSNNSSSAQIDRTHQGNSFMTVVHHEFYYVNNAVNFFIYSLFNQSFRARLRILLAKY